MIRRSVGVAAATTLAALALAACGGGGDPLSTDATTPAQGGTGGAAAGPIIVGSANFPENQLLAAMYAGALSAKGVNVSTRPNIGSREVYIGALEDGSIDVIPEYTGNLARYFEKEAPVTDQQTALESVQRVLPDGLTVLEPAPAENKDALVVTQATATEHGLQSIGDLQGHAQSMVLGGPPEWQERVDGVPGLERVYGLTFEEFRPLDAGGPLTVQALKNGQVQAANLFTTDPLIPANDFVVLGDPQNLFGAQQIIPLAKASKVNDDIAATLNEVSARINTDSLTALVGEVVIDKRDADQVAAEWLQEQGLSG